MGSFSKHLDEYNAYLMEINSATVELVQGIDAIKIFPRPTGVPQRFIEATEGFAKAFSKWVNGLIPLSSVAEVLVSPLASVTWICLTGFFFVRSAQLEPIFILPFLLVGAGLGTPLITLTNTLSKLQAAAESAEQVTTLLEEPTLVSSPSPQTPNGSDVAFDNVTFGYTVDIPAIKGVSFTMSPGTITALVGPSGAGKSTIAHLLLRFADPQEGKITYGGADLRNIQLGELGKYIGFVFQEPYMIRASVSDNIRLARPDASDEDILAAASNAQIHERIQACPKGYQSIVNEDVQFSGGEMQRIAIARALLADTPVLVLDEPTSHADPLSEAALQKAISYLASNKTLLVIAHRLQTISRADQIIVLEEGAIVEKGQHKELVAAQGLYAHLWASSEVTDKGSKPC